MFLYKLFLTVHIVSVIAWMAGLLYLYRLLVYHAEDKNPYFNEKLTEMERRLYKLITVPAMLSSFIFGFLILWQRPEFLSQGWFHSKLLLVIAMAGATGYAKTIHLKLRSGTFKQSGKYLRWLNELPTLLMILIVILVIFKPF